jgi:DNA polymerase-3 subunit alpha
MGKKKPEEMAKQREIFMTGATTRGVAVGTATRIFDLMEKFAGYGFNKSHSAAYALLSYQTAYLKTHYPAAFMAAVMSADIDNTDRLVTIKDDCRRQLGIEILPPSVNRSGHRFSVSGDAAILYGLGAIKGVGRNVVEAIIAERETGGPFTSLMSLCRRIDLDKVNRRALEAMIKAGAMDDFGVSRRGLVDQLPAALKSAEQAARAAAAGQNDMFGLAAPAALPEDTPGSMSDVPPSDVSLRDASLRDASLREWSQRERLANEKEALGLHLTGHPFDAVRHDATFFVDGTLADLGSEPPPQSNGGERNYAQARREVTVAGVVMDVRKRGNRVTVTLDDDSGRMEVALFSEAFQEFRHLLGKDEIIVVSGGLRYDDFIGGWQVNAKLIRNIDRVIEQRAKGMVLTLDPNGQGRELLARLHDVLLPYREGSCEVAVRYRGRDAAARLNLPPEWSVRPSRELRDKLEELLGKNCVNLLYAPGREMM